MMRLLLSFWLLVRLLICNLFFFNKDHFFQKIYYLHIIYFIFCFAFYLNKFYGTKLF